MSVEVAERPMTTEEFLALPGDGVERWLIEGRLREWRKLGEAGVTKRNRDHSLLLIQIGHLLKLWLSQQPKPRGQVLGGEAGCRLRRDPDTSVGIDVVYISPELAANQPDDTTLIEGVPTLVVEVLSPNDTVDEVADKVETYLTAGVPLVWVVNPRFRTVTVHRPGEAAEAYNIRGELSGEPHLPGLRVTVASIFED